MDTSRNAEEVVITTTNLTVTEDPFVVPKEEEDDGTSLVWLWVLLGIALICICMGFLFYPEYKKRSKICDDDPNELEIHNTVSTVDVDNYRHSSDDFDDDDDFDNDYDAEREDQMIVDWVNATTDADGELIMHIELQQREKEKAALARSKQPYQSSSSSNSNSRSRSPSPSSSSSGAKSKSSSSSSSNSNSCLSTDRDHSESSSVFLGEAIEGKNYNDDDDEEPQIMVPHEPQLMDNHDYVDSSRDHNQRRFGGVYKPVLPSDLMYGDGDTPQGE